LSSLGGLCLGVVLWDGLFHYDAELFFYDGDVQLLNDAFPPFLDFKDCLFLLNMYESRELQIALGVIVFV
jgi:hypothetical protein